MQNENQVLLFRSDDSASLRETRLLTDEKEIRISALASLHGGRKILLSERHDGGSGRRCLSIYDVESGQLEREMVFAKGIENPKVIRVVSDPNRILIDVDNKGVQVVDLSSGLRVGQLMPSHRHLGRWWRVFKEVSWTSEGKPARLLNPISFGKVWWMSPLGLLSSLFDSDNHKPETLQPYDVGIFDGGRTAVVYSGYGKWGLSLTTWDLTTGQRKAGPTEQDVVDRYSDGIGVEGWAGIPDHHRSLFITSSRSGWIHWWKADTLQLIHQVQLQKSEREFENQILSLALSNNGNLLAAGIIGIRELGEIHVLNAVTGTIVTGPMVASDFERDRYDKIKASDTGVTALAFFDDDRKLLAGYDNGEVRVWDIDRGAQISSSIEPRRIGGINAFWVAHRVQKAYGFSFEGSSPPVLSLDLSSFITQKNPQGA